MPIQDPSFLRVLAVLAEQTVAIELRGDSLFAQLNALAESDVLRWVIPREFGGVEAGSATVIDGYAALAEACLTTAFVLTQRNGACQRIAAATPSPARQELLPLLARGERFATVGISHLTTSRRHLAVPAVAARPVKGGYQLTGEAPWVTGAPFADHLVTGATLADGTQVLVALDLKSPGVTVEPALPLLALGPSQTAAVRFDRVFVSAERLLFGPVPEVMKLGPGGGTGSLATSALAIGTTGRTLALLGEEAARRSELKETHNALRAERDNLLIDLRNAAGDEPLPATASGAAPSAETLRQRANSLVLRAAQAYLAASKGTGFVSGHPAERAVREAMFFLVWSCPQPVVAAALREFACRDSWE